MRVRNACTAAGLVLCMVAPGATAAAPASHLPDGATIAGVAVGGLGPYGARVALERQLRPTLESPIDVRILASRRQVPTAQLGQVVQYKRMVDAAFAQARRGGPVQVRLIRTIAGDRLTAAVAALAAPYYRAPRSARALFGITHVGILSGRNGRAVDLRRFRRELVAELRTPTARRRVRGYPVRVRPAVRAVDLRRLIPTFVSVSRPGRTVRLFKRLRLVRRYTVAVGAAGFDTPAGLHHVLYKERNPTWHVPNRPWAGSLAGMTIPPGDPRNPLKARFIALGNGVGFHGTADLASIGQAASHGCIRMRIPDVISLYDQVAVGTPVLIR
jgi:hypothetical protein